MAEDEEWKIADAFGVKSTISSDCTTTFMSLPYVCLCVTKHSLRFVLHRRRDEKITSTIATVAAMKEKSEKIVANEETINRNKQQKNSAGNCFHSHTDWATAHRCNQIETNFSKSLYFILHFRSFGRTHFTSSASVRATTPHPTSSPIPFVCSVSSRDALWCCLTMSGEGVHCLGLSSSVRCVSFAICEWETIKSAWEQCPWWLYSFLPLPNRLFVCGVCTVRGLALETANRSPMA